MSFTDKDSVAFSMRLKRSTYVKSCSIGTNRVGLVVVVVVVAFFNLFFYVSYWESTVFGWFSLSTF